MTNGRPFTTRHTGCAAFASTVALCLCAWTTTASSEPAPGVKRTPYEPLQSFSHEFGSKFTSGYFVSEAGKCLVTLMLAEKSDPEMPSRQTPARVRLTMNPGQMAGLDSDEGQSVNFTCGKNAAALEVDTGDRGALVASEDRALSARDAAELDASVHRQW